MTAPAWPKCAFHGIEGHMIGSPACQRTGGPAYKEPTPPPKTKQEPSPARAEIDPDEDYYSNFVDGRGF